MIDTWRAASNFNHLWSEKSPLAAGAAAEATTHGRVLLQTNETIELLTLSEEVVGVNLAIDTLWQLLAAFMVRVLIRGYQPVLPTNSRFEGFVRASA